MPVVFRTPHRVRYEQEMPLTGSSIDNIDPTLPRCQLGVQFLDDDDEVVTPTAGTVAITVMTEETGQSESLDVVPDIDATAPQTCTFWLGIVSATAVGTGVTGGGATKMKLVLTTSR